MEDVFTATDKSTADSSLELRIRDGLCTIEIEHPWYGDSESGFGATLSEDLSPQDAREIGKRLLAWAAERLAD